MVLGLLREVRREPGGKRETRRFETPILRNAERAQAEGRALTAWVREGWQAWKDFDDKPPRDIPPDAHVLYSADRPDSLWDSCRRAPFHMPRWASRLTLLDVTIRRERLGDISEMGALAEGIMHQNVIIDAHCHGGVHSEITADRYWNGAEPDEHEGHECAVDAYGALWDHLHGLGAWESNQDREVMVISFRPVLANIDGIGAEHDERH
jgi:hypothetical protein